MSLERTAMTNPLQTPIAIERAQRFVDVSPPFVCTVHDMLGYIVKLLTGKQQERWPCWILPLVRQTQVHCILVGLEHFGVRTTCHVPFRLMFQSDGQYACDQAIVVRTKMQQVTHAELRVGVAA